MTQADQIFRRHLKEIYTRTDRMFAVLLFIQYLAGIFAALYISPKTWEGSISQVHLHVWAATVLGAAIISLPILLAWKFPGNTLTRHTIAVAQMIDAGLLIHLTGGRIETHFLIFGSLAFLGFYRDSRVLLSASAVVALDHYLRGVYWPESVYGIATSASWRWLEHAGWVLFEDFFIMLATYQSLREMREIARRRADVEQIALERAKNIAHLKDVEVKLKEALEMRDTFLSVCGHELKTPLASLRLSSQLAARTIQSTDGSQRVQQFIDQTRIHSERLVRLVEDMLDVTRIRSGRLSIRREKVDLIELVESVIERCQPFLGGTDCELLLPERERIEGHWDRFRLEQVVLNLITNAIKYGSSRPITIEVSATEKTARISVKDRGQGISEADLERVFQRFERVEKNSSIQGLGLGLYISKNIVEEHAGRIFVESSLGKGSTFSVELPLESEENAAEEHRQAPAPLISSRPLGGHA